MAIVVIHSFAMLTDTHCRNAKPRDKLYRLNDFKGLYLEIKPNGVKAWRYRYKLHGKDSFFSLGDYPSVGLAEAVHTRYYFIMFWVNLPYSRGVSPLYHVNPKCRLMTWSGSAFLSGGRMILFLDFDGVLHPSLPYLFRDEPMMYRGGGELFMWAAPLVGVLTEHPEVQVVLSTNWARYMHYQKVRSYLPPIVRVRVIGSTWHHVRAVPGYSNGLQYSFWKNATRYQQIRRWVDYYRVTEWCAVDDDADGWGEADRDRLIHTSGIIGLSDLSVVARLSDLLR